MVLEVLGVEDGQAVVDIALEAAGEREVWDSGGLRPLLRTHLHLGGTRGGHTMEGLLHFPHKESTRPHWGGVEEAEGPPTVFPARLEENC